MLISSTQTSFPSLYEQKEHLSGCQCASCCKEQGVSDASSSDLNKHFSETEAQKAHETKKESELSTSERQQVNELQQRDSEVRAHEAAHIAAGGSAVTGAASYTYQKGPDGKLYAIGGEVAISSSGGSTPQEKIAIARQIQAGALAPANPSPQDIKVASSAAMMEARARQELSQERSEALKEKALKAYAPNQEDSL